MQKVFKKYIIPIITVFGLITVFDLVFHGVIMSKIYLEYSYLFRPQDEIQNNQNWLHLSNIVYSIVFTYIFSKFYRKNEPPLGQGIMYGAWISLLIWIPLATHNYVVFPYPKAIQVSTLIGHIIESILLGIAVSSVYTEPEEKAS